MRKLEYAIKETLIPDIVGENHISDDTRRIFSLPARLGSLGFLDPCSVSDLEFECSLSATAQLTKVIVDQNSFLDIDHKAQEERKKSDWYKESQNTIQEESSASATKIFDLASEKVKRASCL